MIGTTEIATGPCGDRARQSSVGRAMVTARFYFCLPTTSSGFGFGMVVISLFPR